MFLSVELFVSVAGLVQEMNSLRIMIVNKVKLQELSGRFGSLQSAPLFL